MRSSTGKHYPALDHVRAIAALLVFSWHFTHGPAGYPVPFSGAPLPPLAVFDEGHTGVAVFMALSGYLFAKLLDRKDIIYRAFIWNRILRLGPLLALVTVIVGVLKIYHGGSPMAYLKTIAYGIVRPTLPNGGWSITTEFHFYILLPVLLFLAGRWRFAPFVLVGIALILRLLLFVHIGEVQDLAYWTIVGRIDQFALGIASYYFSGAIRGRHSTAVIIAILFAAFYWKFDMAGGFYGTKDNLIWVILPTIEGATYAFLIAYYDSSFQLRDTAPSRFLGRIGDYSYSIYLIHPFFVFKAARIIDTQFMRLDNWYVAQAWAVVCFLAMVPIGYLSFRFLETPILRGFRLRYVRSEKTGSEDPAPSPSSEMATRSEHASPGAGRII